ncbi:MAG TPA: acyloxyacyl hydrolase [Phycisphaerales bacterium]|nr:acyloxyacyl hydrolase [Phycisphaerales bacterium]
MKTALLAAVLGVGGFAEAARADGGSLLGPGLTLDLTAGLLAAVQPPDSPDTVKSADERLPFGAFEKGKDAGWFITVGVGIAADGDDDTHYNGFVALSTFIGEGLEFQFEGTGWYFDQDPDSTAGGGFAVNLRWHFLRRSWEGGEGSDWTLFADLGIGLIFSGDDVPDGGTSVNFSPRAGLGFTARLGDTSSRLVGGVRWHHMSNARSSGDEDNPDFNAPMFYIGVQWPI